MKADVLIVGASVRSAAESALRAGLSPVCADLFADDDLRAIAEVLPVDSYPHDLPSVARSAPPCPWMYTGALENTPQIIAAISAERTLWGNSPASVEIARSPQIVADTLRTAGLPFADVRTHADPPPGDGTWMLKPSRSGGGRGICIWDALAIRSRTLNEARYFQKRVHGEPCSAVFVATTKQAHLLGISRQLVGAAEFGTSGFTYCGSIGPLSLDHSIAHQVRQAGKCLAQRAKLRGLFGLDFIVDGSRAVVLEINPRYTASIEVFERVYDLAILDFHRGACSEFLPGSESADLDATLAAMSQSLCTAPPPRTVGKAILFASETVTVPSLKEFAASCRRDHNVVLADRPAPGTTVSAGRPICTVLVEGTDAAQCSTRLVEHVSSLRQWLSKSGR